MTSDCWPRLTAYVCKSVHLPSALCNLTLATCNLQSAICNYDSPSTQYNLRTHACRLAAPRGGPGAAGEGPFGGGIGTHGVLAIAGHARAVGDPPARAGAMLRQRFGGAEPHGDPGPRRLHLPVLRLPLPAARLTIDHVLPQSRGGAWAWTNLVAACPACNAAKANRTPEEAGMALLRQPGKPHFVEIALLHGARHNPKWRPYLWTS